MILQTPSYPSLLSNRDRSSIEAPKSVKKSAVYPPLDDALRHRWTNWTKRQIKEVNPAVLFSVLGEPNSINWGYLIKNPSPAIWQYQSLHNGNLPDHEDAIAELDSIVNALLIEVDLNQQVLPNAPKTLLRYLSSCDFNYVPLIWVPVHWPPRLPMNSHLFAP